MGFFMFIDGLAELENSEQWDTAIKLLHRQWAGDKYSLSKAIRLATECLVRAGTLGSYR